MNWDKLLFWRWKFFQRSATHSRAKLIIEKRRCERVPVAMPVFIYGRVRGETFSEYAETSDISAQGGAVVLSAEIERSQAFLITNLRTNEDLACRVARLAITQKGSILVGFEFLRPSPRFWSIDFSSGDLLSGPLR
jgi:hypothetical protein